MVPSEREASVTPCSVLFDTLKRVGHMSHAELAGIVLSSAPLADGRSAVGHASERSWLSRFVVHCPMPSVQPRLFADYASSSARLLSRLRSCRRRPMTSEGVLAMTLSREASAMGEALASFGSDPRPYRNYLQRIASQDGHDVTERAALALMLMVAAGCSANAATAVDYVLAHEAQLGGPRVSTPPSSVLVHGASGEKGLADLRPVPSLGLLHVSDGYVTGSIWWVDPAGDGCVVGSPATGAGDLTDVGADVSSRHLRVWRDEDAWWVMDLGSTNGSWLTPADGERVRLEPGVRREVRPADELALGAATTFVLVEGMPS